MDDNGHPIHNSFTTMDLFAIEAVWRFLEQGAFNRSEVRRTTSDFLRRYGGQRNVIIVPQKFVPFDEYEY